VGAKASVVYKNVQVLGNLSVGETVRLMASITTWVAPTQGRAYCHNTENMADDRDAGFDLPGTTQGFEVDWAEESKAVASGPARGDPLGFFRPWPALARTCRLTN
jgi:hypothetical protein